MKIEEVLNGDKVYLAPLAETENYKSYVSWLNDPKVNRYLEVRHTHSTEADINDFIRNMNSSSDNYLCGIFLKSECRHIGNIKIGPISWLYKHAEIGYLIGDKSLWGMGFATEAIGLICRFGFEKLQLNRIGAGAYECAIGSSKALLKNGFKKEGVLREAVWCEGKYIDIYRYGLLASEYRQEKI